MIFKPTEKEKQALRKPFGKIVKGQEGLKKELRKTKYQKLICVGDFSSFITREMGLKSDISIVDGFIERKKVDQSIQQAIKAPINLQSHNPKGVITKEAWGTIKQSFCYTKPVKVSITGEEDLLFLAAAFFAPLNSVITYGIRKKGGVVVKVNKKLKERVKKHLNWQTDEKVIVGGTFDNLHAGHKFLLLTALERGKKIIVGLTSPKYLQEKEAASFQKRSKGLKRFLAEFNFSYHLYKIDNYWGPADKIGDVIVVSKDTYPRAKEINKMRKQQRLSPLQIIKVKSILAEDRQNISSQRIRKGEIDKNGLLLK